MALEARQIQPELLQVFSHDGLSGHNGPIDHPLNAGRAFDLGKDVRQVGRRFVPVGYPTTSNANPFKYSVSAMAGMIG